MDPEEARSGRALSTILCCGAGAAITFPWTIDGTVRIEVPDVVSAPEKAALTALESGLERVRASTITREESRVAFRVNWFRFVSDWNLLVGIRSGSFDAALFDRTLKLSFSIKSFDLLWYIVMGGPAVLLSIPRGNAMELAIVWTSIYIVSCLVRWLRFRWFVRRCVVTRSMNGLLWRR